MTWVRILDLLKRVPAAAWAALAAALAIGLLYLRGRRLEGELASAKVREHASRAYAIAAKHQGAREVHEDAAARAAEEAKELEAEAVKLEERGTHERERIAALPGHEVHKEYLELARRARERARQK